MGARHSTPAQQDTAPPGQGNEHWRRVVDAGALPHILRLLKPSIRDVFALARSCRDLWDATAAGPPELWQELYVANDPLLHENAPLRKALLHPSYSDHSERLPFRAAPRLAPQGVWCRCCALLYAKPRLVLVLAGRDPVVVRRLGQSDAAASHVTLGINYHLDSYLDDDENRFAAEFPDLYPLTAGDLVVTQDYRGAGCFTVRCWIAPCPLGFRRCFATVLARITTLSAELLHGTHACFSTATILRAHVCCCISASTKWGWLRLGQLLVDESQAVMECRIDLARTIYGSRISIALSMYQLAIVITCCCRQYQTRSHLQAPPLAG